MKIIEARIRTTKKINNVDSVQYEVTFMPQVQYKFLCFTWWENLSSRDYVIYDIAKLALDRFLLENNNNIVERTYEYFDV